MMVGGAGANSHDVENLPTKTPHATDTRATNGDEVLSRSDPAPMATTSTGVHAPVSDGDSLPTTGHGASISDATTCATEASPSEALKRARSEAGSDECASADKRLPTAIAAPAVAEGKRPRSDDSSEKAPVAVAAEAQAHRIALDGEPAHAAVDVQPRAAWPAGTRLEAEMMDPDFPNYTDTIHLVEVMELLEDGRYLCKLLAFDHITTDRWRPEWLHEQRGSNPDVQWAPGDSVHIRLRRRKDGRRKCVVTGALCVIRSSLSLQ